MFTIEQIIAKVERILCWNPGDFTHDCMPGSYWTWDDLEGVIEGQIEFYDKDVPYSREESDIMIHQLREVMRDIIRSRP